MDQETHIDYLISKLEAGTITASEYDVLVEWYNGFNDSQIVLQVSEQDSADELKVRMHHRLLAALKEADKPVMDKVKVFKIRLRYLTAGVAAILMLAGIWFLSDRIQIVADAPSILADVAPGGNKATLTLPDGETVNLNEMQSGIMVNDQELVYSDGTDVFPRGDRGGLEDNVSTYVQSMYTLSTPKGGTYQVTLPDGSKVWLNAASVLKYPKEFTDNERVVRLEGEAFFEVKKLTKMSSVPFKVITRSQTIEVLGTQFNVSAYKDEPVPATTLVEGKVRLSVSEKQPSLSESIVLSPGEQGFVSAEGVLKKAKVNVGEYTAWKDGVITMQGKSFSQLMRELGRWYNLEIEYIGGIPKNSYFGSAYRGDNLSVLLGILESGGIQYRLHKQADGSQKLIIINKRKEEERSE